MWKYDSKSYRMVPEIILKLGKLFKSGPSKIYGRHPLENLKGYGLLKQKTQNKKHSENAF